MAYTTVALLLSSFPIPAKSSRTIKTTLFGWLPPAEVDQAAMRGISPISRVNRMYNEAPKPTQYDAMITSIFPGALSNKELEERVVETLSEELGYTSDNTLLATSLCCDELARRLEHDFRNIYGKNFNLGGLAGFLFAGNKCSVGAHS